MTFTIARVEILTGVSHQIMVIAFNNKRKSDNTMEVDETKSNLHTPLKYHGSWSYKAIKQLIKLHLRQLSDNNDLETNSAAVTRNYERMLRVASSKEAGISPNAVEKGEFFFERKAIAHLHNSITPLYLN